jgi:hypothetical protein
MDQQKHVFLNIQVEMDLNNDVIFHWNFTFFKDPQQREIGPWICFEIFSYILTYWRM